MSEQETSNEELLQMGIRAAKQGQKEGARVMLRQVYSRDKRNERAMLWLARVARNTNERRQWLDRVLKINPNNEAAQNMLSKLNYQDAARDNRTLLVWGLGLAVLIMVTIGVILIVLSL